MGAYVPLPWAPAGLADEVMATVVQPAIDELARRGTPYRGLLYAGLALTAKGVKVVEFNARFGDPETQVVLDRLATPLAACCTRSAVGDLAAPRPAELASGCGGDRGDRRRGLSRRPGEGRRDHARELPAGTDGYLLHAGHRRGRRLVRPGGRVLNAVGSGPDLAAARAAPTRSGMVEFRGGWYRRDIAERAEARKGLDLPQRVSTLELFFDLVFVFTITQLTSFLARDVSVAAGRVLLVFGLLWWMYGGYAWLTNTRTPSRPRSGCCCWSDGRVPRHRAVDPARVRRGTAWRSASATWSSCACTAASTCASTGTSGGYCRSTSVRAAAVIAPGWPPRRVRGRWAAALAMQCSPPCSSGCGRFESQPAHFVERHGALMIVAFGESVADVGIGAEARRVTVGPRPVGDARAGAHRRAVVGVLRHRATTTGRGDRWPRRPRQPAPAGARRLLLRATSRCCSASAIPAGLKHAIGQPGATLTAGPAMALAGGVTLFLAGSVAFRTCSDRRRCRYRLAAAALAPGRLGGGGHAAGGRDRAAHGHRGGRAGRGARAPIPLKHDRQVHAARDGPGLVRGPQVRALVPGGDAGARGARAGGNVPADASARSVRPPPHPRSGGSDRGGDRARRDRVPHRLGGQHRAAVGRRLRALRDDLLRPARHRARRAARRGDRPHRQGRPRWSRCCATTGSRTGTRCARAGRTASTPSPTCGATGSPTSRSPRRAPGTGCGRAREAVAVGKLSGPVGSYSNIDPAIEAEVMPALGLRAADVATQVVMRDGIAEWVSALAVLATVCEAIALEVRHGQRTEVRELAEPFRTGRRARRRCRTRRTRSARSGSAGSPGWCGRT